MGAHCKTSGMKKPMPKGDFSEGKRTNMKKVTRNTADPFINQAAQKFALANEHLAKGEIRQAYDLFKEVKDIMDHTYSDTKAIQYQMVSCQAIKSLAILEIRRGNCEQAVGMLEDAMKRLEALQEERGEQTGKGLVFYFGELYFHRSEAYTIWSARTKDKEVRDQYLRNGIADADRAIEYVSQTEGYGTKIGCLRILQGAHQQKGNAYAILQEHENAVDSFKTSLDFCGTIISMQPESRYTAVRAGNSMRVAVEMASCGGDKSETIAYANKGLSEYSELYNKNKTTENTYNLGAGCYNMALVAEKLEDYISTKNYCDKAISFQASVCEADKYRVPSVYRLLVYFDTILRAIDKLPEMSADAVEKYRADFEKVKEIYTKVTGGAEFKRLGEQQ